MNFLQQFLRYLKSEKRYSKHTLLAYESDLLQFSEFSEVEFEIEKIEEAGSQVIRSWMAALMEVGIDSRSVNRKISSLKSFYKYLMREGHIELNPMTKIISPRVAKKLPSFVPEKDMRNLFSEIEFDPSYEGRRDQLILELFYATGIRRDELINLKISDVDLRQNTIKVLGKRNKERILPIHGELAGRIDLYLPFRNEINPEEPYLILTAKGRKVYPELIYKIVKENLNKITTIKKKSPHVLRHTFATHMLNNGADLNSIKELLGHANLSATQVYTHNSMEKLKLIYKQAHPKA